MARRVKLTNKQSDIESNSADNRLENSPLALSLPEFDPVTNDVKSSPSYQAKDKERQNAALDNNFFSSFDLPSDLIDFESLSQEISSIAQETQRPNNMKAKTPHPYDSAPHKPRSARNASANETRHLLRHDATEDSDSLADVFGELNLEDGLFLEDNNFKNHDNKGLEPANDDKTDFLSDKLLSTLSPSEQRFSRKIYRNTAALSAVWGLGGIITSAALMPHDLSLSSLLTSSFGWSSLLGTILPIAGFWGVAHFIKGARRELQAVAQNVVKGAILEQSKLPQNIASAEMADKVRQDVAAMGVAIERTLERGSELEALIHSEVQNLERAYGENEKRIHKLIRELSGEREAILAHAQRIDNSLKNTKQEISYGLGSLTEELADNVTLLAQNLSSALEQKSNAIFSNLQEASQKITDQFISKLEETTGAQAAANKNLMLTLNRQFEEAQQNFHHHSVTFFQDFQKQLAHSETMAQQIGAAFYHTSDKVAENFDKILHKIDLNLDEQGEKALKIFDQKIVHFDQQADSVLANLSDKLGKFDAAMLDRSQKTLELFQERAQNINENTLAIAENFDSAAGSTLKIFEQRMEEIDSLLQKKHQSLSASFAQHTQELDQNADRLAGVLEERSNALNNSLKQHAENLSKMFSFGHQGFITVVEEVKKRVQNEIDKSEQAIAHIFSHQADNLSGRFAQNQEHLRSLINEETLRLAHIMQDKINLLTEHISTIEGRLAAGVSDMDKQVQSLKGSTDKLNISMTSSFNMVQQALEQHSNNIDIRVEALRDSLSINSFELNKTLSDQALLLEQRVERIRELVLNGGKEVNELIDKQAASFQHMLSHTDDKLSHSFTDYLASLKDYIHDIKQAVGLSTHVKNELIQRIEQIGQNFDSQTTMLEQTILKAQHTLDHGAANIRADLEQSALTLASSLRERIEEAAQLFSIEAKKAETIIDSIEGKLNNSAQQLDHEVVSIHNKIDQSTEQLAQKLQDKLAQIHSYIEQKTDNTSQKLIEAGDYVQAKFDNASQQMQDSLAKLAGSQTALEQRQKQANAQTAPKGSDFTQPAPREWTQNRANGSENNWQKPQSPVLSAANASELSQILQLFSKHMQIFSQANNFFNEANNSPNANLQMKENALSLLYRGINQQMEGTKQAISTFENIIKQSYGDNRSAPLLAKLAKGVSHFYEAAHAIKQAAQDAGLILRQDLYNYGNQSFIESAELREAIKRLNNCFDAHINSLKEVLGIANSFMRQVKTQAPQTSYYDKAPYDNGFAGTNFAQNTPPIEPSLKAISRDIIDAVDKSSLIELWTHYRRGQQNINATRLYTPQGRNLLEQVKKNYHESANFRHTVDQYMSNFEQALNNLAQREPQHSASQMRDYLISDTGKVYTMLAHATNRIH